MSIIGHREQQAALLTGWRSDRLHHAWLLAGPRGVGKATFAEEAARFILTGGEGDALAPKAGHPALALLAAGSHPDFRRLERSENEQGKLRAEIVVSQIRELQVLFNTTPTYGGWRVVIVDSVDELNHNAANAFLKNLEEPSEKTIFFLVSHSPSRLLPTIRSRCRKLRFQPLSAADTRSVMLEQLPEASAGEIEVLAELSEGSPGRALRFAGLEIDKLTNALARLALSGSTSDALALARSFAAKSALPRYEAFVELVPGFIAGEARGRSGASLAHAIQLWEKANVLAAEAVPLAYDPQTVAFELAGCVGALGKS